MGDAFPETKSIDLVQTERQVVFPKIHEMSARHSDLELAPGLICPLHSFGRKCHVSESQNPVTWYIERR